MDLDVRGLHTASHAFTGLRVDDLPQPVHSPVVYCLGNLEAEIKASVVGPTEHADKLALLVLYLMDGQLRVSSLEEVGVDEGGLVVQELVAFAEVVWEQFPGLFLQDFSLAGRNAVPELRLAVV